MPPGDNTNQQLQQQMLAALRSIEQSLSEGGSDADAPGRPLTRIEEGRRTAYLEEEQKRLEEIELAYEKINKTTALDLDYQTQKIKMLNNQAQILREKIRVEMEKGADASEEEFKRLEKEVYEFEKKAEIWKAINKHAKTFEATIGEAASAADQMGTSLGSAFQVFGGNKATNALKGITKALQGGKASAVAFGASLGMALGMAMIDNIANLVIEVYNAENAFRKATGGSQAFANSMTATYEGTRRYGVSIEEASKANQDLFTTFTDFTMTSAAHREDLAKTGAVLSKLGVSTQDFAQGVQVATKMLGVGVGDVDEVMLELHAHAVDLGVAPSKMAADFAAAGSSLAKFGDQGVQAFKDVALASKVTGMQIPKILGLVEKFDTFEGAAEQAGKLNAALGGNMVNAMDLMMETDPTARFEMLRDSILDTGLTFDSMSYYQKQFYTESLGLSDVGDLALMLKGDMDSLDDSIGKNSKHYEDAADRAAAFQSVQEQLKMLMQDMIPIVTPFVEMLRAMVEWLIENETATKIIGVALIALTGIIMTLSFAFAAMAVAEAAAFWPITGAIVLIGLLTAAWAAFSFGLFEKDVGASTFLEGLHKIGESFKEIGTMITDFLLAPLRTMESMMATIGDAMGTVFGSMVEVLHIGLGGLAEDFVDIAAAISEVSLPRAAALTTTLGAAAVANTAATAKAAVVGASTAIDTALGGTSGGAGGGSDRPYNVTFVVKMDGDVLAKQQAQFLNGQVRDAVFTGG